MFFKSSAAALLAGLLATQSVRADEATSRLRPVEQIDFAEMIADLQKIRASDTHFYVTVWASTELLAKSMHSNGFDLESDEAREAMDLFDNYIVVGVMKMTQAADVAVEYAEESELRAGMRLVDAAGNRYAPLENKALGREMRAMMATLSDMINEINDGKTRDVHILVFPGRNDAGRRIASATAEGKLLLILDQQRFDYRLPLGSLLMPMGDPQTGETFPGNYRYNPFTGQRLENQPAGAQTPASK